MKQNELSEESAHSNPKDTPSPRSRSRYRRRRAPVTHAQSLRLIRQLCEAQTDVLDLADQEKISFAKLVEWSNNTKTKSVLHGMCRLNDLRAQLLISRYRTLAAAQLFELSKEESGGETARKACVDLLKLCLAPMPESLDHESAGTDSTASPECPFELRLLLTEMSRPDTRTSNPERIQETALDESGPPDEGESA